MSLSERVSWEVRTTGNDTNGGGFNIFSGGLDYSQQDNKNTVGFNISTTDVVANGTTTITSATANFGSSGSQEDPVGNIIYLQGGSGGLAEDRYEIITTVNSTTITLDRAVPAGTGITMNIGGALATPGKAAGVKVQCNFVYIKSGTYLITTATPNISNGPILEAFGTGGGTGQDKFTKWIGYQTTRGDLGTRPILRATVGSIIIVDQEAQFTITDNLELDGDNQTDVEGYQTHNNYNKFSNLVARNCTKSGITIDDGNCSGYNSRATGCTTTYPRGAFSMGPTNSSSNVSLYNCIADNNNGGGFVGVCSYNNCIATFNTQGFFGTGISIGLLNNCTVAYNTSDGVFIDGSNGYTTIILNSLFEGNGGHGINTSGVYDGLVMQNCGFFSNTSGNFNIGQLPEAINPIVATSSFFTDGPNGDFSLNSNAGGGALARAAGIFTFPDGLTTTYPDLGAAQSQEVVGSINLTLEIS